MTKNEPLKPICFMVMPFGIKETHTTGAPAKVNFDRLWNLLFKPLIEKLGYEPVRADVDLGTSIIRDMIERLALSDLVLADVTIANANVFYEVGIRHAACESGCVLLAASWAKAPFDTQSMRREPFELAGEDLTDEEARVNLEKLEPRVRQLATSKTPCYEMEGFPKLPITRAQAFRDWLRHMNAFNADLTAIRLEPDLVKRREKGAALVARYIGQGTPLPLTVAYELVKIVRDTVGWKEVVEFIQRLPQSLRDMPLFIEQQALARSKSGEHHEAIAALLELIKLSGESAERWGLIGGRYKKLFRETRRQDPALAADYLDRAIEHYERGRLCDLNDYYASSNLPLLLRTRGNAGDAELAARIAVTVVAACERAIALKLADEWVYPTLLVAAFQAADLGKARELLAKVRINAAAWKLATALEDLEDAVALQPNAETKAQLNALLEQLRVVSGAKPQV
jgi:tetratricopeptide (TPR) repeat protein